MNQKCIVWDAGGVIFNSDTAHQILTFENGSMVEIITPIVIAIKTSEQLKQFDRGDLSLKQLSDHFAKKFSVDTKLISKLMHHLFDTLTPNWPVIELIKRLKNRGYKQYLLTNGSKEYFEYMTSDVYRERHGFSITDLFDVENDTLLSAEKNVRKPEAGIYEIAEKQFNIAENDTVVFIDDVAEYCQTANDEFNWNTIQFVRGVDLVQALSAHGIDAIPELDEQQQYFRLYTVTDTHGAETSLAKLNTAIKQQIEADKKNYKNIVPVLLICGDVIGVNRVLSSASKGEFDIAMITKLCQLFPQDKRLFVPGNHDFYYGDEVLKELVEKSNLQVVISNATFKNPAPFKFSKHVVLNLNGKRVSFAGLMLPSTQSDSIGEISQPKAFAKDPDFILSHLGLVHDLKLPYNSQIIGGHSHKPTIRFTSQNHCVINGGAHGETFCTALTDGKNILHATLQSTTDFTPDEEMLKIISEYEAKARETNLLPNSKEACFSIDEDSLPPSGLDATEAELRLSKNHLRNVDSVVTRLTADAFSDGFRDTDVIGFLPAAAIRSKFFAGQKVTMRDLIPTFYDNNRLVRLRVTGKDILLALTNGVLTGYTNWHNRGGLLHPSDGFKYHYDLSQKPEHVIQSVTWRSKNIDLEAEYDVVTTNWAVDGAKLFPTEKIVEHFDKKRIPNVVATYAKGLDATEKLSVRVTCAQTLEHQEIVSRTVGRSESKRYVKSIDFENHPVMLSQQAKVIAYN